MSSNSACLSSPRRLRVVTIPICAHGFEADLLTSHTPRNPNRRFFCCCVRKLDDCKFFRWAEFCEATETSSPANSDLQLQMVKEDYENQLRSRAMAESILTEQVKQKECELSIKNEVILVLQARLEESKELKKWFMGVLRKLACLLIFIIGAFVARAIG